MRVLVGLILLAGVAVAYPWAALAVAGLAVLVLVWRHAGRRQTTPAVRRTAPAPRRLSTADHLASRRAWAELHEIERAAGIPYTPKTRPEA